MEAAPLLRQLRKGLAFDPLRDALIVDGVAVGIALIHAALVGEEEKRIQVSRVGSSAPMVVSSERVGDSIEYSIQQLPQLAGLCWKAPAEKPLHSRQVLVLLSDGDALAPGLQYGFAWVKGGAWASDREDLEVVLWRELAQPETVMELRECPWPL